MQIKFAVLSPQTAGETRRISAGSVAEACHDFADDEQFTRIAFGGRTSRGRGGVTITLKDGELSVGGHKLEPISDELAQEAAVFRAEEIRQALGAFARGMSVCIRARDGNAVLLRWDPIAPEVFAIGEDSAH